MVVTSITLLRLKPGGSDTIPPPPSPPPFAAGVGDAVALSGGHGSSPAVAHASVVTGARRGRIATPPSGRGDRGATRNVAPALAPAHVVAAGVGGGAQPAPPGPSPAPPPIAQPVSAPAPPPPSPPVTGVAAPILPISAGVVSEPSCEGEEYTIAICVVAQTPPPEGDDAAGAEGDPAEADEPAEAEDDSAGDGEDGAPAGALPSEQPSP